MTTIASSTTIPRASKNENKTYNHRTWGKKNANEVKDREKNNSNLKINTKDNKKWLGR